MVNAAAYPGVWAMWVPVGVSSAATAVLDILLKEDLVEQVGQGWQITFRGFPHIVHFRVCNEFEPVLHLRAGRALKDCTHWELITMLEQDGWRLVVSLGRIPALLLDNVLPADRVVYFAGVGLDMPASYLECLLSIPDLLGRGVCVK